MVCSLITRKILLLLSKKNTRHFPKANLSLVSAESHPSGEMVTPWTTPQSVECERWSTFHRRIHTKHGESLRYFAHTLFRHIKILIDTNCTFFNYTSSQTYVRREVLVSTTWQQIQHYFRLCSNVFIHSSCNLFFLNRHLSPVQRIPFLPFPFSFASMNP